MTTIVVVDYGMGNLRSVAKALEHVAPKATVLISGDAQQVRNADRLVLPGQGAMPDCMRHLDASGLREVVLEAARSKPLFGVCVGEQMLFEHSEEGNCEGLGLLPGRVIRFAAEQMRAPDGSRLKVPHMGWNALSHCEDQVFTPELEGEYVYYVHSYYVEKGLYTTALSEYTLPFSAGLHKDNFYATQFHVEKSGKVGETILRNFLKI